MAAIANERAGHEFGEAEPTWWCSECGEVDDLQASFPELWRREWLLLLLDRALTVPQFGIE